jgi:hypothetical protein
LEGEVGVGLKENPAAGGMNDGCGGVDVVGIGWISVSGTCESCGLEAKDGADGCAWETVSNGLEDCAKLGNWKDCEVLIDVLAKSGDKQSLGVLSAVKGTGTMP